MNINTQIEDKSDNQDDMIIHIYANTVLKTMAILVSQPVSRRLTKLEFDMSDQCLTMVVNGERRDICKEVDKDVLPLLFGRNTIDVFQIDMDTKEPVNGFKAPLSTLATA